MGPLPGTYPGSTEKKTILVRPRLHAMFASSQLPPNSHTFHSSKWQDNCHIGKTLSPCHVCLQSTLNPSFVLVTGQLPYGKTPSFVFSLSPCIQVHFFVVWQDNCHIGKTLSTPAFFLYNLFLHPLYRQDNCHVGKTLSYPLPFLSASFYLFLLGPPAAWIQCDPDPTWSYCVSSLSSAGAIVDPKLDGPKWPAAAPSLKGATDTFFERHPSLFCEERSVSFPAGLHSPFLLLFSLCASSSPSSSRNSVYYLRRFQWSWTFDILLANWTMRLMLSAVGLVLMKYLFHFKHLTEWEFLSLICGFHVLLHESIRMMHSCYGNFLIVEFPSLLKFQNHTFMGICLAFLDIWGRLIKGIRDHLKYELVGVKMAPSNQKRVSSKRRKTVRMNKGKWEN